MVAGRPKAFELTCAHEPPTPNPSPFASFRSVPLKGSREDAPGILLAIGVVEAARVPSVAGIVEHAARELQGAVEELRRKLHADVPERDQPADHRPFAEVAPGDRLEQAEPDGSLELARLDLEVLAEVVRHGRVLKRRALVVQAAPLWDDLERDVSIDGTPDVEAGTADAKGVVAIAEGSLSEK